MFHWKKKRPLNVCVSGAGGAVGYSLLFSIIRDALTKGNGHGDKSKVDVNLRLLEAPGKPLEFVKSAVEMEILDCASPFLRSIICTADPRIAFDDADCIFLIGGKKREEGMERADLLRLNAPIFAEQGRAIGEVAANHAKVVVVANPSNTNALVTAEYANRYSCGKVFDITAMSRLDHNRGVSMLAEHAHCSTSDISRFCVWGNHSSAMLPDTSCTLIQGHRIQNVLSDEWLWKDFVPAVKRRGDAIIKARGASSAASAAFAAFDHMHDWMNGTNGKWVSMAVPSDGFYGVPYGLFFSVPCVCQEGKYKVIKNLKLNDQVKEGIETSVKELIEERDIAFTQIQTQIS